MKTNVSIDLSDEERTALAQWLDGKRGVRMATRANVNELVTGFVSGIVDQARKDMTGVPEDKALERLQRFGPNPDAVKQTHPHKALIERNIKTRNMTALRAKGYWRGWTMRPFTNK